MEEIRNWVIEKATTEDIDAIVIFYEQLLDYLEGTENYPGWRKNLYPTRETAMNGIAEGTLYLLRIEGQIAGSVVLNHDEPEPYGTITQWGIKATPEECFFIHTLCVHPNYLSDGVGKKLLVFTRELAEKEGMKAVRLDVAEQNKPAIGLYEKMGYIHHGVIDLDRYLEELGLREGSLKWFNVYEIVV